jgi:cystathionine gamma-synthase
VEQELGRLDGGHALLFPSGTAAAAAIVLTLAKPGATIAVAEGAYYGHTAMLEHLAGWGIGYVEFDQTGSPPAGTDLIFLEAPSNPVLTMPDFEAAAAHPAPVVCDATIASPLRIRPIEHGCDLVLHSATKVLAGHDDVLAGVTVARDHELRDRLHETRRLTGMTAAPDTAWLLQRGLKTLAVRLDRQEQSARILATMRLYARFVIRASLFSSRSTSPTRMPPSGSRRRSGESRTRRASAPSTPSWSRAIVGKETAYRPACSDFPSGSRTQTNCGPISSRRSLRPERPWP